MDPVPRHTTPLGGDAAGLAQVRCVCSRLLMQVERSVLADVTLVTPKSTYSGGGVYTVCPRCHHAIEIRLRGRSVR